MPNQYYPTTGISVIEHGNVGEVVRRLAHGIDQIIVTSNQSLVVTFPEDKPGTLRIDPAEETAVHTTTTGGRVMKATTKGHGNVTVQSGGDVQVTVDGRRGKFTTMGRPESGPRKVIVTIPADLDGEVALRPH
jgi:hypothetical protein